MIWPGRACAHQGHDVDVVMNTERYVQIHIDEASGECVGVNVPDDVDVVVLQRPTHLWLVKAIKWLRAQDVAVVVDIDDDLSSVHVNNPAFAMLHPGEGWKDNRGRPYLHSWRNLAEACKSATMVTVSTPGLLRRYAQHGRGRLLHNYLADHYYGVPHVDSTIIGWPATIYTHPNDPEVSSYGMSRVLAEFPETSFVTLGENKGVMRAFGLRGDDPPDVQIPLLEWPSALGSRIGIGVAPLADTVFNASKSWLKPLEMSAAGVPWVASARAEYVRLHNLGCGLTADRPKDWYRELRKLVQEPNLRAELSESGRAVAETLRLEDHAWRWWEAWSDALDIQRGSVRAAIEVPGSTTAKVGTT